MKAKPSGASYAAQFVTEPEAAERARARAGTLTGAEPVSVVTGSLLSTLAGAAPARHVIEIGTGAGVSGLWLLAGMPEDAVLTTIDVSLENQQAAREAFAEAGHPHQRTRLIAGSASQVLPRMSEAGYDLAFLDADPRSYPGYVEHMVRLLRPGGMLVINSMLAGGRVADPTARDANTTALRGLGKDLRDSEDFAPALLPIDDGILVALRR